MKVMQINECGDSSVFHAVDKDMPKPNKNQVLVKTVATSVNPIDTIERGMLADALTFPAVLHTDFAGVIEALGDGVTGFAVGDAVYGCCGHWGGGSGALAEYQTVDAGTIAHAPKNIPLNECASLPLVAITAWEILNEKMDCKAHQKILVQSATGGVGYIVSQIAQAYGLDVYGITTSDDKVAQLTDMGVTACNRKTQDQFEWVAQQGGFDVVINTVGGGSINQAFELVNPYGTVISIAGRSEHNLSMMHNKNLTLTFEFMITTVKDAKRRPNIHKILTEIARLVDGGKLAVNIAPEQFTLDTVGDAHDYMKSGGHGGKKILINVNH